MRSCFVAFVPVFFSACALTHPGPAVSSSDVVLRADSERDVLAIDVVPFDVVSPDVSSGPDVIVTTDVVSTPEVATVDVVATMETSVDVPVTLPDVSGQKRQRQRADEPGNRAVLETLVRQVSVATTGEAVLAFAVRAEDPVNGAVETLVQKACVARSSATNSASAPST